MSNAPVYCVGGLCWYVRCWARQKAWRSLDLEFTVDRTMRWSLHLWWRLTNSTKAIQMEIFATESIRNFTHPIGIAMNGIHFFSRTEPVFLTMQSPKTQQASYSSIRAGHCHDNWIRFDSYCLHAISFSTHQQWTRLMLVHTIPTLHPFATWIMCQGSRSLTTIIHWAQFHFHRLFLAPHNAWMATADFRQQPRICFDNWVAWGLFGARGSYVNPFTFATC